MNDRARRAVALGYGLACHITFAVAILLMVLGLWNGMGTGLGGLNGGAAIAANLALAVQFPALHSWLLSRRGQRVLRAMAPASLGTDLAPTVFATIAALQLLATFLLWSPSGIEWWQPTGALRVAWIGLFASSWLLLVKALVDGDLRVQTGLIGWRAVWAGERPRFGPMPQHGLFDVCRQPIYLGFAATLWTGPVWTPDHLAIASIWTIYCVLGPLHKERRFARIHGETFFAYQRSVPYMIPRIRR